MDDHDEMANILSDMYNDDPIPDYQEESVISSPTKNRKRKRRSPSSSSSSSSSETSSSSDNSSRYNPARKKKNEIRNQVNKGGERKDNKVGESVISAESAEADDKEQNKNGEDPPVDIENNNQDDIFQGLNIIAESEEVGPNINEKWSELITKQWESEKTTVSMKPILEKFKIPNNLSGVMKIPKMNFEIYKLLNRFQRLNDQKLTAMQRILMKITASNIKATELVTNCQKQNDIPPTVKQLLQINLDTVGMIEHLQSNLSDMRRQHAVAVLKQEYKSLSHHKGKELLFGEISKEISNLNLTNRVGSSIRKYDNSRKRKYQSSNGKSFLDQGRYHQKPPFQQRKSTKPYHQHQQSKRK